MSNVDTQSNPSDFDFADMQQDSEDIEEVTVMRPDTQRIDVNLMMVLNRFNLSEEIIANFGLYQIRYSQLKALEREDLIKLGISDNKLQEEMLEEFQHLGGQEPTLKETLELFRSESMAKQGRHMIDAIQEHLVHMNRLLGAITYQLEENPSAATGIIIDQQFSSTKVALDLINQLQTHSADMEEIIEVLKNPERQDKFAKKKRQKGQISYFVIIGSIGMLVAGFFIARRFGMKKLL